MAICRLGRRERHSPDRKTSQRCPREHLGCPPFQGRRERHWLAFYDVHADTLWGYVRRRKRREEVLDVLKRMRRRYPPHLRIHLIPDNFSPHSAPEVERWCAANNVHLVWAPTNASWPNPLKEFLLYRARGTRDLSRWPFG